MTQFDLGGRLALVTGAGSGLGRQFATTLAAAGATVALAARRRHKLEETAAEVQAAGGQAHILELDVTDSRSVSDCFAALEELTGAPDIVVNNAGIARAAYAVEFAEEDWDAVIDTNLKGVFLVAQAAARSMIAANKGGSIINIASILGLRVTKTLAAYSAAKSGVVQLTKALALEFVRQNIRVNAIAPGYFVTEMNAEEFAHGGDKRVAQSVPMGRVGELAEISGPLLLLASDAGSYMTGSVLAVDGGHLCSAL